jgi:putative sigma-54 modulation protein
MISPDSDAKITMQGIHFELTEAMRSSILEKFSVLLRHNERIIRVNVRVQSDQQLGNQHHYTATGEIEIGGPNLVARVGGMDAYALFDELVEKLDRLLRDRQGHRKDKRNHPQIVELDAPMPKTGAAERTEV